MSTPESLELELKQLIIEALALEDVTPENIESSAALFVEGDAALTRGEREHVVDREAAGSDDRRRAGIGGQRPEGEGTLDAHRVAY